MFTCKQKGDKSTHCWPRKSSENSRLLTFIIPKGVGDFSKLHFDHRNSQTKTKVKQIFCFTNWASVKLMQKRSDGWFSLPSCVLLSIRVTDCSKKANDSTVIFAQWHITSTLSVSAGSLIIWLTQLCCCNFLVDSRIQWKSSFNLLEASFLWTTLFQSQYDCTAYYRAAVPQIITFQFYVFIESITNSLWEELDVKSCSLTLSL